MTPSIATPLQTIDGLTLAHFLPVIADASARVSRKTEIAISSAVKRFAADATSWEMWIAVFTREQIRYTAAALAPILQTYTGITGRPTEGIAASIGGKYGEQLAQYLATIHGGAVKTVAPDLAAITMLAVEESVEKSQ